MSERTESEKSVALVANQTIKEASFEAEPILQKLGIKPEVYYQIAVNAILRNPQIANCQPKSLRQTLLVCAERGLIPDGESAAIVPFKSQATLMVMVGGMYDLVRRVNKGFVLRTKTIFIGEEYEYLDGLVPALNHDPEPDHGWGEQNVIASYAVARPTKDSDTDFVFMFKEEIETQHRSFSRASNRDTPWYKHYERMCEKTVARQLLKKYPIRSGLLSAGFPGDSLDDYVPAGDFGDTPNAAGKRPEAPAERETINVTPTKPAPERAPERESRQTDQSADFPPRKSEQPEPAQRGFEGRPAQEAQETKTARDTAKTDPASQKGGRKRSSWRDQNRF